MELIFQGQRLELMADRAVYWSAQQAILVADLHWGKDATFRAHGIPVSRGQLEDELQRLNDLCQRCLLYTSPSPRDLSTSRMPSSA